MFGTTQRDWALMETDDRRKERRRLARERWQERRYLLPPTSTPGSEGTRILFINVDFGTQIDEAVASRPHYECRPNENCPGWGFSGMASSTLARNPFTYQWRHRSMKTSATPAQHDAMSFH